MGVQVIDAAPSRDSEGIAKLQWTLKGIDPQTRDLTRQAARKSGMLLGTWVEHALRTAAEDQLSNAPKREDMSNEQIVKLLEQQNRTIQALEHQVHVLQAGILEKLVAKS